MEQMIQVRLDDTCMQVPKGITYEKIVHDYRKNDRNDVALVKVDGKIQELIKTAELDCEISMITLSDPIGHKTYVRSAIFLFVKAATDVIGREKLENIKVEFSIGRGYYCSMHGEFNVNKELAERIQKRMEELVQANVPIEKRAYPTGEARALFHENGMTDKEKLFWYRRSSYVNVYNLDGYQDYYYGYMLPSTGYIRYFEVLAHEDGFILNLPDAAEPETIKPFEPKKKLFDTLKQANDWNNLFGINTVGDLNEQICHGNISDLILVQEAQQERRIGEIAREIVKRGGVKLIMIAGPSSSGKTTFSHRLSIQLRTLGLNPHPIAVDDYFVNRELTPRQANGDYNFECLEAIDVKKFNEDMTALLAGETVEMPRFNFKSGVREYKGDYKKLGPDDVLVIEGIHCLNDKLSYSLPGDCKFKIYISALTTLNVDEHNRIATTDGRLLRRMVRDARTRGASAKRTIQMWPSVRQGEEENIFPYQESADVMFNSALIYELAVLKQFAEPLLFGISQEEPEYYEAKRLLKFLEYFLGITSEKLPNNSIVREFVGGSCFPV